MPKAARNWHKWRNRIITDKLSAIYEIESDFERREKKSHVFYLKYNIKLVSNWSCGENLNGVFRIDWLESRVEELEDVPCNLVPKKRPKI